MFTNKIEDLNIFICHTLLAIVQNYLVRLKTWLDITGYNFTSS